MQEKKRPALLLAWELWRRRHWLAILTLCTVVAVAGSILLALPDVYRATVTVVAELPGLEGRESGETSVGELETRLHTVNEEILSHSRLLALVDQFHLYPKLRKKGSMQTVVKQLRRAITFELKEVPQPWGRVSTVGFELSYLGSDPETVAKVANRLAELYVEEDVKLRERRVRGAAAILQAQLEDAKKELDAHELQIAEYKRLHLGELPQQMEVNLSMLERLNGQVRFVGENLGRATERRSRLLRELDEERSTGGVKGTVESPAQRLLRLRQELSALEQSYTARYPDISQRKAEIAELERRVAKEQSVSRETMDPAAEELRQVEEEIAGLQAEEARLKRTLQEYQRRVENAPRREQEFLAFSRDYATSKALYESLLARYEQAQISGTAAEPSTARFRILDRALVPQEPDGPNRMQLLLVALVLAVGAAAGLVMLVERSDTSFHNVDDVRAFTRVPLLGTVPVITTRSDTWRRRGVLVAAGLVWILGLAVLAGASYRIAAGNDQFLSLLTRGRS